MTCFTERTVSRELPIPETPVDIGVEVAFTETSLHKVPETTSLTRADSFSATRVFRTWADSTQLTQHFCGFSKFLGTGL